ncbi:MAG: hypothetical protein ACRBCK_00230 [Alphaproteobacteria bacterium]
MSINFNEKSSGKPSAPETKVSKDPITRALETGERPRFIQKANSLVDRAYQIFEYDLEKSNYEHVGDYVLIDTDESREVTDKKVMNLITLINGKTDLVDISNLTKSRVMYTLVPEAQAGDQTKIIFKDYDGSGVSKDNAVFTIRKGVLHDKYRT